MMMSILGRWVGTLLGLAIAGVSRPAWAAPPDAVADVTQVWVAVGALKGKATGSPKRTWRLAMRDDEALRLDKERGLALYYVLAEGPGPAGVMTVMLTAPVSSGPLTLEPGAYHVVAIRLAKQQP